MSMIKLFSQYHELLAQLTSREIKQRYKQSVLGYAWVILNPFFQMLVMAFVYNIIMRVPDLGVPYSIYLYAGLLPWTLFNNSLTGSVNSLVGNAGLLSKIYFPREIFVMSTMLAKMVDFALSCSIFVIFMIYFQIPVTWNILWVIPILLIQQLFTYALSLFLAAANLFYRDIQYLLNLVLLIWMYLTPVIYATEFFPEKYQWIFKLNPMAIIINAYRQVILAGGMPNLKSLGLALLLSLGILALAYKFFKKVEGLFADVV